MSHIVWAKNMKKVFKEYKALDGLDINIKKGSIYGLLGRNGAGKTTTIKCLLGLYDIDEGESSIFGEKSNKLSEKSKSNLAYVPQENDLIYWMKISSLLNLIGAFYPSWDSNYAQYLLGRFCLDSDATVSTLIPGQKQCLSIVMAFAHHPELIILDEPASTLDPQGRKYFTDDLLDLIQKEQTTVLYSSHITTDMEKVCDTIGIIKNGKLVIEKSLDELKNAFKELHIVPKYEFDLMSIDVPNSISIKYD